MDYQYQTTEQPSSPRKAWPIVLAVVVALIVACGAGVCVYRNNCLLYTSDAADD